MKRWRVQLPPSVRPPFEVYVNGVPQKEGADYRYRDGRLVFDRPLTKEGRVALWRWLVGAFGVGTYRHDDTVDVRYELEGRQLVAHALEIEAPDAGDGAGSGGGGGP